MAAQSLEEQLLSISGIESAQLDGTAVNPEGVKVRLATGADPAVVGLQVQAVLQSYGLRSRIQGDRAGSSPPPPPGAPASVIDLPTSRPDEATGPRPIEPETLFAVFDDIGGPAPASVAAPVASSIRVVSVAVEEAATGVAVTVVAGDGRSVTRAARPSGSGLDESIVAAVGELSGRPAAAAWPVEVVDHVVGGSGLVIVVVERGDGGRGAGAALLDGGRAFAVAKAAQQAIEAMD